MYELVKRGVIVKVIPPLYKIKKGKKDIYLNTNKDYAEYIRKEIASNLVISDINGKKLKSKELEYIIENSIEYTRALNKYSRRLVCDKSLLEVLMHHYEEISDNKYKKLEKDLKKRFEFIRLENNGNTVSLTGTINKEFQRIFFTKNTIHYLKDLFNIHKESKCDREYILDGEVVLFSRLLIEFEKYEPKHKTRYKGLGEMNATQLWDTTMNPENRNVIKLTTSNYEEELEKLRILHSSKTNYREERKKLLYKFKIDRDEIDT